MPPALRFRIICMTDQHGKSLTCLPCSDLLVHSPAFNGIFFLPGLQQWFYFYTHTSQMPLLTGIFFLASVTALSLNVTSSVHFSYTPTSSTFLWEWKTKEEREKNRGKIRNKGHLTYRTVWQRPGGPRDHILVPHKWGTRQVHPDLKLCAANWLIFWTFLKYVCKTACKVFKVESVELPPTSWRTLEWGLAHWETMFHETDVLPLHNCISPPSSGSASSPIPESAPSLQMLSPGRTRTQPQWLHS